MADITPTRIEPLSDGGENSAPDSGQRLPVKQKTPSKPAPAPPLVETDEKDETHQLDELA